MRFRVIDTFRGLAAVMVIFFHMGNIQFLSATVIIPKALIFVDFFFVLSGFVISHTYLRKLRTPTDFNQFVWKRFARLYPLHFITLLLFLTWECTRLLINAYVTKLDAGIFERNSLSAFLSNLTLTHSLGLFNSLTWNDPSWSISTEFYVYLTWGFLLVFCRKYLIILIPVLFTGIGWFIFKHKGSIYYTYDYGFIRCLYGFLTGYCTYLLYIRNQERIKTTFVVSSVIEFIILGATISTLYFFTQATTWLMPFVFALLIIVFSKEAGVISQVLRHPYLLRLGDLSYSYYLNHYLVITVLYIVSFKLFHLSHNLINEVVFVLFSLLSIHALSEFTHRYVEFYLIRRPVLKRQAVAHPV